MRDKKNPSCKFLWRGNKIQVEEYELLGEMREEL